MKTVTMIKNLAPSLAERGKIKIGQKGRVVTSRKGNEFQPPQKLDHFKVVTMQRGPNGNFIRDDEIHHIVGESPTELPVRLLYDDIALNFQCRYTCYRGRVRWCYGDGERAFRVDQSGQYHSGACPCGRIRPEYRGGDACKINGALGVIIDGAAVVGGVWRFRTTSYNSTVGILSSLAMIKTITGGPLAGIPLTMRLSPKTVNSPDGRVQTIYVVGLEYRGTVDALRQIGYQIALDRQTHQVKMDQIETHARRLLAYEDPVADDDTIDEHYPEQAAEATGATIIPDPGGAHETEPNGGHVDLDGKMQDWKPADMGPPLYPPTFAARNSRPENNPAADMAAAKAEREAAEAVPEAVVEASSDPETVAGESWSEPKPEPPVPVTLEPLAVEEFARLKQKGTLALIEENGDRIAVTPPEILEELWRKVEKNHWPCNHPAFLAWKAGEPTGAPTETAGADVPETGQQQNEQEHDTPEPSAPAPPQWTGAPDDPIGLDQERTAIKRIMAEIKKRELDDEGVKLAMRRWSCHDKDHGPGFRPFDLDSRSQIPVRYVTRFFKAFLPELEPLRQAEAYLKGLGGQKAVDAGVAYIKEKKPDRAGDITHLYELVNFGSKAAAFIQEKLDEIWPDAKDPAAPEQTGLSSVADVPDLPDMKSAIEYACRLRGVAADKLDVVKPIIIEIQKLIAERFHLDPADLALHGLPEGAAEAIRDHFGKGAS